MTQDKLIYWVSTAMMCALFAMSAAMYIVNYDSMVDVFERLGFPGWLVYPLAIFKILGIIAILSKQSKLLKEWAYAGFFFDAMLAFGAHYYVQDGGTALAVVALVLIVVSRYYDSKLYR